MPDLPLSYGQARKGVTRAMAEQSARVQKLARDLVGVVYGLLQAGRTAEEAVTEALESEQVEIRLRTIIGEGILQGLCIGAGIWPLVAALPAATRAVFVAEALTLRWRPNEMDLSTRIHGTVQAFRGELVKAIEVAQNARESTWRTARKIYDGYGFGGIIHRDTLPELPRALDDLIRDARKSLEPADVARLLPDVKAMKAYAAGLKTAPLRAAYTQLLDKIEKGNAKGFERAVKTATEEKARYHAERIQRTEFARSWGEGVVTRMEDDPDVAAVKSVLSSAHKLYDVCDFHAKANHFGLGPGIYPLSRRPPFPYHPHCFCQLEPVFLGEVPEAREFDPGSGKRFLEGLRKRERDKLLTINGSRRFREGADWQMELRQWNGVDPHPSKEARDLLKKVQATARVALLF